MSPEIQKLSAQIIQLVDAQEGIKKSIETQQAEVTKLEPFKTRFASRYAEQVALLNGFKDDLSKNE